MVNLDVMDSCKLWGLYPNQERSDRYLLRPCLSAHAADCRRGRKRRFMNWNIGHRQSSWNSPELKFETFRTKNLEKSL